MSVALRTQSSPSSVLMPMGFASLLGGTSTTIGTSTNLLIVEAAQNKGLPSFGMFDFFLPALFASVLGIAFLWIVGPLLLPKRDIPLVMPVQQWAYY